jgi:hypothetical protein
VFLDTAGLYALADHRDPRRQAAVEQVQKLVTAKRGLVLTDYVVDEGATLAKARAGSYAAMRLLELLERSAGHVTPEPRQFGGSPAGICCNGRSVRSPTNRPPRR